MSFFKYGVKYETYENSCNEATIIITINGILLAQYIIIIIVTKYVCTL